MTNISLQKKEVFWDFDGTLFDSYPWTIAAVQEVFHAHHIDVSSQEIHDRMMTTVYQALQEILAEHPSDCRIEECLAAIKKDTAVFLPQYLSLFSLSNCDLDARAHCCRNCYRLHVNTLDCVWLDLSQLIKESLEVLS